MGFGRNMLKVRGRMWPAIRPPAAGAVGGTAAYWLAALLSAPEREIGPQPSVGESVTRSLSEALVGAFLDPRSGTVVCLACVVRARHFFFDKWKCRNEFCSIRHFDV